MDLNALFDGISDPVKLTRFDPSAPGSRGEHFQSEVDIITGFKRELLSSIKRQREEESQKMNVRYAYYSAKIDDNNCSFEDLISQETTQTLEAENVIVPKGPRPKRKQEIDISDLVLLHTKRTCTLKTANIPTPPQPVTGPPSKQQTKRKRGERGPGKKIKDIKDTEITKKTTALNKEVS
jgi:hypothetical protein